MTNQVEKLRAGVEEISRQYAWGMSEAEVGIFVRELQVLGHFGQDLEALEKRGGELLAEIERRHALGEIE